jgi:hypothetical protein
LTIHATDRPTRAFEGWVFDLKPMWSMARHFCGRVDYLPNPTGEDIAQHVEHHRCRPGAAMDPVLGQDLTVEIDLGPVSEIVFGSFALMVESLPYGLLDRHPRLRAQAERVAEGLASHLDIPEPDPPAGPELPLEPPVYVSVAQLDQTVGRLPDRVGARATGVMWVGPDGGPGPEICARHLTEQVLCGELQRTLDGAALGIVTYDAADCPLCDAAPHLAKAMDQLYDETGGEPDLDEVLDRGDPA